MTNGSRSLPASRRSKMRAEIRRRFLARIRACRESQTTKLSVNAYMTFVIVGAGPTGVEISGAMSPIALNALYPDFRHIDTRKTKVILVEGGRTDSPFVSGRSFEERAARASRTLASKCEPARS